MKTLTLTIPETFDIDEKEAKTLLAAKLYEKVNYRLGKQQNLQDIPSVLLPNY